MLLGRTTPTPGPADDPRVLDGARKRPRDRGDAQLAVLRAELLDLLGVENHHPENYLTKAIKEQRAKSAHRALAHPHRPHTAPKDIRHEEEEPAGRRSRLATAVALALTGCVAGEGTAHRADDAAAEEATAGAPSVLNIDFATYNPLSLIIKDQGWLEEALGDDVTVNWIQSAGSNKANEALRAGAIDVGSTAGSAALLARSNGSPIKAIDIYSQPNWAAIARAGRLGHRIGRGPQGQEHRRHQGHRPVLLPAAVARGGTVSASTRSSIENLQHADGKAALEAGAVDAWSGLDPLLSTSVATGADRRSSTTTSTSTATASSTRPSRSSQKSPDLAQVVVERLREGPRVGAGEPG